MYNRNRLQSSIDLYIACGVQTPPAARQTSQLATQQQIGWKNACCCIYLKGE